MPEILKKRSNPLIIGEKIKMADFISVVQDRVKVELSQKTKNKVKEAREVVDSWVEQGKKMYGITTGFGALCDKVISKEETEQLQKNILLSHSTSIGDPFNEVEVRAIILMVIQNISQGYSGIRLETLEFYIELLNREVFPYVPKEGSVGYLSPEAHIGLVAIGLGKAYVDGKLVDGKEALNKAGLKPLILSSKEGLVLVSATTSTTGLALLSIYEILNTVVTGDIISAMTLETLKGTTKAYDDKLSIARPHLDQKLTAENLRNILSDSERAKNNVNYRLQDALSIRCVPQLHGAAKKTLKDALTTIEIEMNSCCDNPIIWKDGEIVEVLSGGNPDSSYIGIEMDSACIAATIVAKMSERRNNRLIDGNLSEMNWFLVKNPGLNSGLMIPHYTQAGLLNDMKIMCTPNTIDNIPTCGNQEDYVAMGYNSAKKSRTISKNLSYILAIELLSVFQANYILENYNELGSASKAVISELRKELVPMEEDIYLYPHIEHIKDLIINGTLLNLVEKVTGNLKL